MVPNATIVTVSVVVVSNNIANLGYVVRVEQVGLALVAFEALGILINIEVIITAEEIIHLLIIVRP